jgi:predicted phage terminase large subunit-like protein
MENTYQEYQNKMLDRMNDGAKKILVGTLWSVLDPLVREEHANVGNPRARFRKIPALNENDESNFQYEFKGFSSKYYLEMRERLDKAEWCAKFQQAPFVREGLTFPIEELRFFDGNVPDTQCRTIAALDPAFGSGDSLSMPVCKDFGNDKYIIDWVHDKRTVAYTLPLVADKIEQHTITELKIEKNRGGDLLAEQLQKELDARKIRHCHITLENAPVKMSKEDKISGYSDFVKRHFQFLSMRKWTEESDFLYRPSEQYRKAIDEMTMFSAEGKNISDDAPDAITQLAMMFEGRQKKKAVIIRSPF